MIVLQLILALGLYGSEWMVPVSDEPSRDLAQCNFNDLSRFDPQRKRNIGHENCLELAVAASQIDWAEFEPLHVTADALANMSRLMSNK